MAKKKTPTATMVYRPTIDMVYLGATIIRGGKLGGIWFPLDRLKDGEHPDRDDPRTKVYEGAQMRTGRPGRIERFECERNEDDCLSVFIPGQTQEHYADRGDVERARVVEWEALHDAALAEHAGRKKDKEIRARSELKDAIEPLRGCYMSLRTRDQKAAFLAAVVSRITM